MVIPYDVFMDRMVNENLLNSWIDENSPCGLETLSQRSQISSSTIARARTGEVPKRTSTRRKIAAAVGVPEEQLFPFVSASGEAS